jgi:hypothetical protein
MPNASREQPQMTAETVAMMAEALGRPITPERLPDVATVLSELFALEAVLAGLDLDGIDPDSDDADWGERRR